jgi:hypothetical protein
MRIIDLSPDYDNIHMQFKAQLDYEIEEVLRNNRLAEVQPVRMIVVTLSILLESLNSTEKFEEIRNLVSEAGSKLAKHADHLDSTMERCKCCGEQIDGIMCINCGSLDYCCACGNGIRDGKCRNPNCEFYVNPEADNDDPDLAIFCAMCGGHDVHSYVGVDGKQHRQCPKCGIIE